MDDVGDEIKVGIAPEVRQAIAHDRKALRAVENVIRRNPRGGQPIFVRWPDSSGLVLFGGRGPAALIIHSDAPVILVKVPSQ